MKIGYSVEGSTDRALLEGLRRRWCPQAILIQGQFRGQTGQSARREILNICIELAAKGVDFIIFLRDSNTEEWREVLKSDEARCPPGYRHLAIFGVCMRNVECWICSDTNWIAARMGRSAADFHKDDPKGVFESVLCITAIDKKEDPVAQIVVEAPLHVWLANPSFKDFYGKLWQKSKELGCAIENLRERSASL